MKHIVKLSGVIATQLQGKQILKMGKEENIFEASQVIFVFSRFSIILHVLNLCSVYWEVRLGQFWHKLGMLLILFLHFTRK